MRVGYEGLETGEGEITKEEDKGQRLGCVRGQRKGQTHVEDKV